MACFFGGGCHIYTAATEGRKQNKIYGGEPREKDNFSNVCERRSFKSIFGLNRGTRNERFGKENLIASSGFHEILFICSFC